MAPHSDTLSWFRADQSLLFLLNAACLPEKQQISIYIVFGSTALEASTLTITPPMRFVLYEAAWTRTENYHFPHSDIFFHRKQKSDFYFFDIKKISNFPSIFISTQIYMVRPYTVWKKNTCTIFNRVQFSLKTRVQFCVIRQQMK
jgi:hypothetical protein